MKKQIKFIFSLFLIVSVSSVDAVNDTVPAALQSYSTIQSIGFEWPITGDDNHNASVEVLYRELGSATWLTAQNLFRVDFEVYNMLAGSILFLESNTSYEVNLILSDSDGGGDNQTVTVATQKVPAMPMGGSTYHVIPGSGGGDGSVADPFKGINAAQSNAVAGDVFLLHAGDYGTQGQVFFTRSGSVNNHIVWKSAGDGDVVFNQIRMEADYVWLEGLHLLLPDGNTDYGIRTSPPGPLNVVIKNNRFDNCHICIYLNDGGQDWYIVDNTIVGDNDPALGSNFSGEGIELWHTSGHTVAYNSISRVADGISYPHINVDIFGNDIFDTTDDGIEGDFGHNNIRIWGNRIANAFNNGISFQPMDGAPWYVLYNQVAAPGEDALKLRSRIGRVLLAHNTLVAWNGPVSSDSVRMRNMQSNNNLWVSVQDRYIWENGGDSNMNWRSYLDYDGFDWGNYIYAFKWGDRLDDLVDFQNLTGQELNAIRIDRSTCFSSFDIPGPPPISVPPQYLSLNPGCNAVDAGLVLANINDGYTGTAPDLGAHEINATPWQYGPRESQVPLLFEDSFE